jgi:hypothetical protein
LPAYEGELDQPSSQLWPRRQRKTRRGLLA